MHSALVGWQRPEPARQGSFESVVRRQASVLGRRTFLQDLEELASHGLHATARPALCADQRRQECVGLAMKQGHHEFEHGTKTTLLCVPRPAEQPHPLVQSHGRRLHFLGVHGNRARAVDEHPETVLRLLDQCRDCTADPFGPSRKNVLRQVATLRARHLVGSQTRLVLNSIEARIPVQIEKPAPRPDFDSDHGAFNRGRQWIASV
mmetsp:Transcript_48378/g.135133  ORF Transcript_48378/g.135133 Transcript_48378/m.135133 type:complete len:206 (-) Transcript_48378:696-1313(-)